IDPNGNIVNAKLYLNDNFIRQEIVAPYDWGHRSDLDPELKNMAPGTYTLKVVVEDNDGETTADEITITVNVVTSTTTLVDTPFIGVRPTVSANSVHIHLPPKLRNKPYYIFNTAGQVIRMIEPKNAIEVLNIGDFPSGIYFVYIDRLSYRFVKL
ncbi:MAG: T9SS type A sorting domain-containing protein, partial [Saprospiraceae bacterium]